MKKIIAFIPALIVITALLLYSAEPEAPKRIPAESLPEIHPSAESLPHGNDQLPLPWYRNHLGDLEQEVYAQLETGIRSLESDIPVSPCDADTLARCMQAILDDNPDMFWVSTRYTYQQSVGSGNILTVSPQYTVEDPDVIIAALQRYEKTAAEVIASLPEDDYGKARGIYTWICKHCSYREDSPNSQSIAGVFDDGVAACAGYARTFQYLSLQAGLPCMYVSGTAMETTDDKPIPHGWNAMCLDGVLVYLDVTWGDRDESAPIDYSWLGLVLDDISTSHVADPAFPIPEANNRGYDIWSVSNSYFQEFDREAVYTRLAAAIVNKEESTALRFGERQSAEEAYSWIADSREVTTRLMRDYRDAFPDPSGSGLFSVYKEEGLNALVIIWHFN